MRRRFLTILFIAAVFGLSASSSTAQIPAKLLQDPRQLLTALISALQTGQTPDLQQWLGGPLFQTDARANGRKGNLPAAARSWPHHQSRDDGAAIAAGRKRLFRKRRPMQNGGARWVIGVSKKTGRIETANVHTSHYKRRTLASKRCAIGRSRPMPTWWPPAKRRRRFATADRVLRATSRRLSPGWWNSCLRRRENVKRPRRKYRSPASAGRI